MNSFTDIRQFRQIVRSVRTHHDYTGVDENGSPIYKHTSNYPTLKFKGTVKLHGTNAAIVIHKNGTVDYQSRERIISVDSDNHRFALYASQPDLMSYIKSYFKDTSFNSDIAVFGEWCGGNIQKGVAISELPKMWVVFAVKIDNVYIDLEKFKDLKCEKYRMFNILQFPTFSIDIDFEHPENIQNKLVELTNEVERECPVAKYFNVCGIGEGIVWQYISDNTRYIFKVKGEKHQSSKIKKLVTVDVEELGSINDFIQYALTDSRLNQGISKLKEKGIPIDIASTGDYLRWVVSDVMKEEMDTIVKNQINIKKMNSAISLKARQFWLNFLNNNYGY
jgi:hypothetical protein